MARDRRNHYRVLFVQPEAPPEVIKAAWRALTATLRAQPDLGGQAERMALLNMAYAVLSDPVQRAAYDLTLRAPEGDTIDNLPRCPLCGHRMPVRVHRDTRCVQCDSPLHPAPDPERVAGSEWLGRRRGERFQRAADLHITLPGVPVDVPARLRDLSLGGLSFHFDRTLPAGSVLRVRASDFDALAEVASSRSTPAGTTVHAKLRTLLIERGRQGVVVNERA